ncbi:hypothetical protein [Kitasatospora sp. NPDC093102]
MALPGPEPGDRGAEAVAVAAVDLDRVGLDDGDEFAAQPVAEA